MSDHDEPSPQVDGVDETEDMDFDIEISATDGSADDGWKPTIKQLMAALDDEDHPHHEEAVQRNKELAEQMRPALDSLRKTMMAQTKLTEPILKQIAGMAMPKFPMQDLIPKLDLPSARLDPIKIPDIASPHVEMIRSMRENTAQLEESMHEAAQARAARLDLEDERADKTLAVLESMDANIRLLSDKIEGVDQRIESGNKGAGKAFWWTFGVATATLLATVIGVVIALLSR